jgi:hypothetical protein
MTSKLLHPAASSPLTLISRTVLAAALAFVLLEPLAPPLPPLAPMAPAHPMPPVQPHQPWMPPVQSTPWPWTPFPPTTTCLPIAGGGFQCTTR